MDSDLLLGLVRVAVILALLGPAVYFVTRWYGKQQIRGKSVTIREVVPLGINRALYVVEWEERRYLLAVAPHAVQVIDTAAGEVVNGEEPK